MHTVPPGLDGLSRTVQDVDMIVVCASKLETIHVWDTKARAAQKLLSAAMVKGPVGLVFNDFADTFEVDDVDGESYPEVRCCFFFALTAVAC